MDRSKSRRSPEPYRKRDRYDDERRHHRRSRSRERRRRSRSYEKDDYRTSLYRSRDQRQSIRHDDDYNSRSNRRNRSSRRRSTSRDRYDGNEDGHERQSRRHQHYEDADYDYDRNERNKKKDDCDALTTPTKTVSEAVITSSDRAVSIVSQRVQQPTFNERVSAVNARAAAAASAAASIARALASSSSSLSCSKFNSVSSSETGTVTNIAQNVTKKIDNHTIIPHASIPAYYNASKVNAARLAEQQQKRKFLWGDTKNTQLNGSDTSNSGTSINGLTASSSLSSSSGTEARAVIETSMNISSSSSAMPSSLALSSSSSSNVWTNLKFQGEHGSAMTEKFRKLMGIKSANISVTNPVTTSNEDGNTVRSVTPNHRRSEALPLSDDSNHLFKKLDAQYEQARAATHTNRGMGLGYN